MRISKKELAKIVEEELQKEGLFDFFRSKKKEPEEPAQDMSPEGSSEEDLARDQDTTYKDALIRAANMMKQSKWQDIPFRPHPKLDKLIGHTWFTDAIEKNRTRPWTGNYSAWEKTLEKTFPMSNKKAIEHLNFLSDSAEKSGLANYEPPEPSQQEDEPLYQDVYGGDHGGRLASLSNMEESETNDSMTSLMENWRKYEKKTLLSENSPAAQALVKGQGANLHGYTALLKKIAADPAFRKLALAGRSDGNPQDEMIKVVEGKPVAARNLTPTQKDIDLDKSLGDQMTNKWNPPATTAALATKKPIMLPSPGGAIPILVFENKYILDGHHRWSQVMMTNPEGVLAVSNLTSPAFGTGPQGAERALKATQLAIAGLAGNVETKGTGTNLLSVNEDYIKNYVRKKIQPEALKALHTAGKISKPDAVEEAAEHYARNLADIKAKPPGAFDRVKGMPQADDSGVPQAKVNKALAQGVVNFNEPSLSDTGKKSKFKDQGRV
jgi:hypothetical protein